MKISCVWEHNGDDTLLYAVNYPGAFARGCSLQEAMEKMPGEIVSYLRWRDGDTREQDLDSEKTGVFDMSVDASGWKIEVIHDKPCDLQVCDADSDVLFDTEREPLTREEYQRLKALVLKSAEDFHRLYESISDKNRSCLTSRKTF